MLNARYHEQEAQIISLAGVPGATLPPIWPDAALDIQLGGTDAAGQG